jgi:FkbM family methyltransferase
MKLFSSKFFSTSNRILDRMGSNAKHENSSGLEPVAPPVKEAVLAKPQADLKNRGSWPVDYQAEAAGYKVWFHCRSDLELKRAKTLATKETGTVEWIANDICEGDVFCDIGANIGVYSFLACNRVGSTGKVYSFEPHVVNVAGMMASRELNAFSDRMKIFSFALSDSDGIFDFQYSSLQPGVAFNQLLDPQSTAQSSTSQYVECKVAFAFDSLIERGTIECPNHIKIDVDGIEPKILGGMSKFLRSSKRPRTIQIEVDPTTHEEIYRFMDAHGYRNAFRHETQNGKNSLQSGAAPETIPHNVIFRP